MEDHIYAEAKVIHSFHVLLYAFGLLTYSDYIKNCTESRNHAIRVASVVVVDRTRTVDIAEVGRVADIR